MEKFNIKKVKCQAKVMGTLLTVAGAMLMTLYKGPTLINKQDASDDHHSITNAKSYTSSRNWFIGSISLVIANLAWASLFLLQVRPHDVYNIGNLNFFGL